MAIKSKVQLELVGRLPRKPGGSVGYMTLYGPHLFLVNEDAGLQVVDASNPAAPRVAGSYRPKGGLGPVAVSGGHAYVVEKENSLRVVNVANPARPRAVGLCQFPDDVQGLEAVGGHVYVSFSESRASGRIRPRVSERVACGNLNWGRVTSPGISLRGRRLQRHENHRRLIRPNREIGSFEGPGNVTRIASPIDTPTWRITREGCTSSTSRTRKPQQSGGTATLLSATWPSPATTRCSRAERSSYRYFKPKRPKEAVSFSQSDCDTAWSVAVAGEHVYTISDAGVRLPTDRRSSQPTSRRP